MVSPAHSVEQELAVHPVVAAEALRAPTVALAVRVAAASRIRRVDVGALRRGGGATREDLGVGGVVLRLLYEGGSKREKSYFMV